VCRLRVALIHNGMGIFACFPLLRIIYELCCQTLSNFTLFILSLKCDIPFYVEYSDYLYYLHCWEYGVLQLVLEQVGPSGQVVESRSVVCQLILSLCCPDCCLFCRRYIFEDENFISWGEL